MIQRKNHIRQNKAEYGFTAIELLITLFIAAAFLISGYQLFSVIIKSGGEARAKAKATNIAYDYLQRYKTTTSDPCVAKNLLTDEIIDSTELADVSVSITVSCPYTDSTEISKINVEFKYNDPQEIINISTYNTGSCPVNYILVPGSATYGTNDFCVMKYEAKADDNGDGIGDINQTTGYNTWPADTHPISDTRKLVSSAQGYPVAYITQTAAIDAASNPSFVAGCIDSCHLMTEAEWMTIAQNVLSVRSNWSSGTVGTDYIYSGHNDGTPNTALVADDTTNDGYYLTGQTTGNQRRTLTLTNGEVIWDFAGNLWEWTSGQMASGQPTGMASWNFYEWPTVSGGSLTVNPFPSNIGITGSDSWSSSNGIGQIYGLTSNAALVGFFRGGNWTSNTNAGVLTFFMGYYPSNSSYSIGLRVSQ